MNMHWWNLLAGALLIFSGAVKLITGEGSHYWGAPVSPWAGLIFLPVGIVFSVLSIRALLRGEGKKPAYTEEDAARAKAKLDRMHLREHGSLPEAPTHEEAKLKTAPEPPTPEQNARISKTNAKIRQGSLLMLAGGLLFYAAGSTLALIPAVALFLVGLTRLAVGLVERS